MRAALFVASVALLVYFLPRTDKDRFIYEVNRPWSYALLTAPFDIPEHLDSVSASHLKDSIDARFEPVFKRDLALEKTIISDYSARLNATPGSTSPPRSATRSSGPYAPSMRTASSTATHTRASPRASCRR